MTKTSRIKYKSKVFLARVEEELQKCIATGADRHWDVSVYPGQWAEGTGEGFNLLHKRLGLLLNSFTSI